MSDILGKSKKTQLATCRKVRPVYFRLMRCASVLSDLMDANVYVANR